MTVTNLMTTTGQQRFPTDLLIVDGHGVHGSRKKRAVLDGDLRQETFRHEADRL